MVSSALQQDQTRASKALGRWEPWDPGQLDRDEVWTWFAFLQIMDSGHRAGLLLKVRRRAERRIRLGSFCQLLLLNEGIPQRSGKGFKIAEIKSP